MRLGYVKGNALMSDRLAQDELLHEMDIEKLYVDMAEETVNMKQLIVYCRRGDTVVVRDIRDLSDTAGGFVNILAVFAAQGVNIVCDLQKIDTSTFEWIALMKVLRIYGEEKTVIEKDKRWLADLDAYFDLVEKKEITVAEVCKRMNIGKTTYYRRLHQVKTIPVKERYVRMNAYYIPVL